MIKHKICKKETLTEKLNEVMKDLNDFINSLTPNPTFLEIYSRIIRENDILN